jgi:lysozyme
MSVVLRRLAVLALSLSLPLAPASGFSARQLVDLDPHEGVARAHRMPVQGIDVSNWQGDINWDEVRAAGTQFAFIKATEGGDYLDPKFRENWYGAKQAGISRGAYHMLYWCRSAREQALWFVRNVPQDADALPPVLDLEWNHHSRTCPQDTPPEVALKKVKIILEVMEAYTGKRPIIYTDVAFHREVLEGELGGYNFWLRSVAAEPQEIFRNRPWLFWQFTTTGRVPGIRVRVDRNVFNGTAAEWLQMLPASPRRSVQGAN